MKIQFTVMLNGMSDPIQFHHYLFGQPSLCPSVELVVVLEPFVNYCYHGLVRSLLPHYSLQNNIILMKHCCSLLFREYML